MAHTNSDTLTARSSEVMRINPDIDYIPAPMMRDLRISHMTRAGDSLYISGIAPVRAEDEALMLVAPGDFRQQLRDVLDILARSLHSAGGSLDDVVVLTLHVLDTSEYDTGLDLLEDAFRGNYPASTLVGVDNLYFADQRIEVSAIACVPEPR